MSPRIRDLLDPEHRFGLASDRSAGELRARLMGAVDPRGGRWFLRARRRGLHFEGAEEESALVLRRLVPYPDPWRPTLRITLTSAPRGTLVEVRVRWTAVARKATLGWLGLCLAVLALSGGAVLAQIVMPRALILGALALAYAPLPWLDLWFETRASRRLLARLVG